MNRERMASILKFAIILLAWISCPLWAKVKIEDIQYKNVGPHEGKVEISYSGELGSMPEMSFNPSLIQLVFSEAVIWPKVEKRFQLQGKEFDATLMGYQYSKDLVRVRVLLPFPVEKEKHQVKMTVNKNKIELSFPKKNGVFMGNQTGLKANEYDESYLNLLLKEKEIREQREGQQGYHGSEDRSKIDNLTYELMKKDDEVRTKQAAAENKGLHLLSKQSKQETTLNQYIVKFFAVMVGILALFYGLVHLFKKGVLNKGKLNFLGPHQLISVLGNTYIGPKRNLLLVKVQNQVFLLGNSETGISFLSEIKDVTGVMKKGEYAVAGSNFDSNLDSYSQRPDLHARVKMKEMDGDHESDGGEGIHKYNADGAYKEEMPADRRREKPAKEDMKIKDRVKFSEQIKSKLKTLKPLM